jgi:rhamnogalacturonyl hydrolase YesR
MKRVADWQIKHLRDDYGRKNPKINELNAWTYGTLYIGLMRWAEIAGEDTYSVFLKNIGEELEWKLAERKYHADDQVISQLYLDLYRKYRDPRMLEQTKQRCDWICANPSTQEVRINRNRNHERWTWCDALFMAPPVWAKLANITGDPSYLDWMCKEYKATVDHLYDPEENLFFRDENYIKRRKHGRKVFWARGNGWVFGGLALIIPELPEGGQRDYFVDLYRKMAPAVANLQTEQGHWAMSLLAADVYPTPETSGTAFFTFGLAWGINEGLIDRAVYEPVVLAGWNTLVGHITKDGMLGYVQPVGAAPGNAWPDKTEVYGTGAFLAAGAEVCRLLGNGINDN